MDDLRTRFLILDRVQVPELWADVERRAATTAAESGRAHVTVRVPWVDGEVRSGAGAGRSPLGRLVWAALLGLLLISAIALGGLIAGAWSLDDFRVPAPPGPSPCEPGSGLDQPGLDLEIEDQTGLVASCMQVDGTLVGDSLIGAQVEITNPANDQTRLEVKWVVSSCDIGATLLFSQVGDGYDVRVEDRQQPPCAPGSALAAVELRLREAVPAITVSGSVNRVQGLPPVPRAELIEQPTGSMLVPRFDHGAVLLGDGRVLVTGGFVDRLTNPGSDTIAELFDPETGTFSTTGRMSVARESAIAVVLSDGRVLVAGGSTSHPVDANRSAEVYDPGTGTFSGASPMAAKRTYAAAAVLDDGRVLIVGGDTDGRLGPLQQGPPLPLTAEIFDPGHLSFQMAGVDLNFALAGFQDPFALTLDDGNVFVAGSAVEPIVGPPAPMMFDPSSGAVSILPPIDVPDVASAPAGLAPSAVIDEGKVLFAARFADETWRLLELDPRRQSYRVAATLPGRPAADLVTIMDGRIVLIIEDPTDCSRLTANAFDPSDGSLREIGRIANLAVCGGESFTVTALANGGALIAGGDPLGSAPETVIVALP